MADATQPDTVARRVLLEEAIDELGRAIVAPPDMEALSRLWADDYVLITRRGQYRTRSERLEMLRSGQLQYRASGALTDVVIRQHGDVAIVTGLRTVNDLVRRFTAIWVFQEDRWRQALMHHTVVSEQ